MTHMLYVMGEPGVGKSTLMDELVRDAKPREQRLEPIPHMVYLANTDRPVVELGKRTAQFPGTDALSMGIGPKAIDFVCRSRPELLLAEGDRLAYTSFFSAALAAGYGILVAYLFAPEWADKNRRHRADQLGRPPQDERWVRGRRTKLANLHAWLQDVGIQVHVFDGDGAIKTAAKVLRHHPCVERLQGVFA